MSGSLIPLDGDHDDYDVSTPERGLTSRERPRRDDVGGIIERTHGAIGERVDIGPWSERTPHPSYELSEPDEEEGELSVPMEHSDGELSVPTMNLTPDELAFFRQELDQVKPALAKVSRIIGSMFALEKARIFNDGREKLERELQEAAGTIKDFIDHASADWGFLQSIASRLPHGINLADDLQQIPGDLEQRVTEQPNAIDLLAIRQHIDMLTLTVRALDKVLPPVGSNRLLTDKELGAAIGSVVGKMELPLPGVDGDAVDIFQYEIVRDGLDAAESAAKRLIQLERGARLSDGGEHVRCMATLQAFYGLSSYNADGREFNEALAVLGDGLGIQEMSAEARQDVQNALEHTSDDGEWYTWGVKAAESTLENIAQLRRQMRPRLQYLRSNMPSLEAVTVLTPLKDAWRKVRALLPF